MLPQPLDFVEVEAVGREMDRLNVMPVKRPHLLYGNSHCPAQEDCGVPALEDEELLQTSELESAEQSPCLHRTSNRSANRS